MNSKNVSIVSILVISLIAISMPDHLPSSETDEKAAVLVEYDGFVLMRVKGNSDWEKIETGHILQPGDSLKTGERSEAVLLFKSGERLKIGAEERICIGSGSLKKDEGKPALAKLWNVLSGALKSSFSDDEISWELTESPTITVISKTTSGR